jgi:hypothetical protein
MILFTVLLKMGTFGAPLPQMDGFGGGMGQMGNGFGGGIGHMGGLGGMDGIGSMGGMGGMVGMDGGMGQMGRMGQMGGIGGMGLGMGSKHTPKVNLNKMEAGNTIKDNNGVGMTWKGWNIAI